MAPRLISILITSLTVLLSNAGMVVAQDTTGMVTILDERFEHGLNRFDGSTGVWSTLPRRKVLMTNAAEAVFMDHGVLPASADKDLPILHSVADKTLSLRSARLPGSLKDEISAYMAATRQGNRADKVQFVTSQINTGQTWAQAYGYFEIEAKIPKGKGRWPAFWLSFAGRGWPPEIDVFEAYGAGLKQPTKKDNQFNTAVFFDALDEDGAAAHDVDVINPFAPSAAQTPKSKRRGDRQVYNFQQVHRAEIYDRFNTYAMLWTPTEITFYFGPDATSLQQIYKVPTPDDAQSPMYLIANDQFTARGGWWSPRPKQIDAVLSPDNSFDIKRILVKAFVPDAKYDLSTADLLPSPHGTYITDTAGDDDIALGGGFDVVNLSDGADRITVRAGQSNKVIFGFGPDDHLTLNGFPFADATDIHSRLTQVNDDVWLTRSGDPFWPQTILLKNTRIAALKPSQFQSLWPRTRDHWAATAMGPVKPQRAPGADGILRGNADPNWLADGQAVREMRGGGGDDRYRLHRAKTRIVENENGGIDSILTRANITLPQNVEVGIAQKDGIHITAGAGPQRLETAFSFVTLQGREGDDLYALTPTARGVTIKLSAGSGHDQISGFDENDQLWLHPNLNNTRGSWVLRPYRSGTILQFSTQQSVYFTDLPPQSVAQISGYRPG